MLFVMFRRNRLVRSPRVYHWYTVVNKMLVTCSDMIFTLPWNSDSISDISYVTGTGENGNLENEVQNFNLFVANADTAHTTKYFQFHIIINKSYQ